MIWADRVGLVWALVVAGVMLFLMLTPPYTGITGINFAKGVALFAGIPWLLLRGADFIATGTIRRGA